MDVSNGSRPEDGQCAQGIKSRVVLSCNLSSLWEEQDLTGFMYVAYAGSADPCEVSAPSIRDYCRCSLQAPPNLRAGQSFETKHTTRTIKSLFVRSDQVFKLIFFLLYHLTSPPGILALHSAQFKKKGVH